MKINLGIGLDPSYRRFGFAAAFMARSFVSQTPRDPAVFVTCHRELEPPGYLFYQCQTMAITKALWLKKTIETVIELMWSSSFETLKGIGTSLVVEIPPPVGQFSAGLYLLGGIVLRQMEVLEPKSTYIYPTQLRALVPGEVSLKGVRRKGNSTFLAKAILEENPEVCLIKETKRWNNDEAEAFLLCVLGANNRGPFKFKMPPYLETDRWDVKRYDTEEEAPGKSRKKRGKKGERFF